MGKRGQVTVFIIIGIIVLILVGVVLWMTSEKDITEAEAPRAELVKIPQKAMPIREFVNGCLQQTARQGLILLGEHGGYIDPLAMNMRFDPGSPTTSELVEFFPDSKYVIPYWHYLESANDCEQTYNCKFGSKKPFLFKTEGNPSIEGQLDAYINKNLGECLRDFEDFKEQRITVKPLATPSVDSKVTAETVSFFLDYPLEVQIGGDTLEINEYMAELDVPLKDIYEIASMITEYEASYGYLAKAARQIIEIYSRTDADALPPTHASTVSTGPGTIWVKQIVQGKVKSALANNIDYLQVLGSRNYFPVATDQTKYTSLLADTIMNRGQAIPINHTASGKFNINFKYLPIWEPYFNINCKGQLCKPESIGVSFIIFYFGIQKYDFMYDLSYPVLVSFEDPDALLGEGYTFQFFIEGNMRNNKVLSTDLVPGDIPEEWMQREAPLTCDVEQRISAPVEIRVVEAETNSSIADTGILFKCGDQNCMVGLTEKNGVVNTQLPRCLNGILSAQKNDYFSNGRFLNTFDDLPQNVTIPLERFRTINITADRYLLIKSCESCSWEVDINQSVPLDRKEQLLVIMTREQGPGEDMFSAFATVYGNPAGPKDESENIKLVPGTYDITMLSIINKNVTIPEETRKENMAWYEELMGAEDIEYTIPEIAFEQFPAGRARFTFEITADDLDQYSELQFSIVDFALDRVQPAMWRHIEDLSQLEAVENVNRDYHDYLAPKWSGMKQYIRRGIQR